LGDKEGEERGKKEGDCCVKEQLCKRIKTTKKHDEGKLEEGEDRGQHEAGQRQRSIRCAITLATERRFA